MGGRDSRDVMHDLARVSFDRRVTHSMYDCHIDMVSDTAGLASRAAR